MTDDALFMRIQDAYDESHYPSEFASEYSMMECLAERNGVDTFLVQNHAGDSFVAKCYDKSIWSVTDGILDGVSHPGLPKQLAAFENQDMLVTVREYIKGTPLDRYMKENELTEKEIIRICARLCDILACLHHRDEPIIHRDIKPQNIIVRPDESIVLIDFDIARVYRDGNDMDTRIFGTLAYAPPEQFGFSQTDCRTDIYSLGVLLRYLLTGSTKENKNVKVYRPLAKIISKCTGFAPKERFSDVTQVKKALLQANPKSQRLRAAAIAVCALTAAALLTFGGVKAYQAITYTPFTADAIPAVLSDEERIADAVSYMKVKYVTNMFDATDDVASVGLLRRAMIELYGLERDYVYGVNTEIPNESDEFFMPWNWADGQTVDRDVMVYATVKVHDPAIVADWSSLKDDNGYYPGLRVAVAFAEETGIVTGANRPKDITVGEMALILANADRVFEAAEK